MRDAPASTSLLAAALLLGATAGGCGHEDAAKKPSDPGRVTLHRLNRAEYNNTVRDLLGTARRPADDFPADDRGYGFDNNADVLSLSPLVTELYVTAAEGLVDEALAPTTGTPPQPNPQRARILICDPAPGGEQACARTILTAFGRRAFRRPLTEAEVTGLVGFLQIAKDHGDGFEQGLNLALTQILSSPNFLFRVERDPDPTSTKPHPLTDHELATRLSYFLWSTTPDEGLLEDADAGRLSDPDTLASEVYRMLEDPRAEALLDNFAGQWLHTRALYDVSPDPGVFPRYDDPLRDSMAAETRRFFKEFLRGDATVDQLLTADFTFVDQALAHHYEMAKVDGDALQRVSLIGPRRGLLGQGSVLTVTSYPTRTSPVKRGKWVLEQLLCAAPPPPPPGVPALPVQAMPSQSMRDELAQHRKDPVCASCHQVMDPIGLGLEHFDGVGAYRSHDSGFAIDTSGDLGSGQTFADAQGLEALITADPRFPRCVGQQLYTYALGRGPEALDDDRLDAIRDAFVSGGYRFPDLIRLIVLSDGFRMRRGEPAGSTP
jgi:hypothetical protein